MEERENKEEEGKKQRWKNKKRMKNH